MMEGKSGHAVAAAPRGRAAIHGRVEASRFSNCGLPPDTGPKGQIFVHLGRGSKEPLFHNLVPKNTFVRIFVEERPFMAALRYVDVFVCGL
jgi:hypothetical protein